MFNIQMGYDYASLKKSYPVASGETLKAGEWVVFKADGSVTKQTGVYDAEAQGATYPVLRGTDKLDNRELGRVTLAMGKFLADVDKDGFAAVAITPGKYLTLKDGVLVPLVAGASALNIVAKANSSNAAGTLEFVVA